jgi:glycosyltransferase involved in cell wall biosynthesis
MTRPASSPPDLAVFLPSLAGGGAERVMLDLIAAALEQGRSVELVLASRHGAFRDEVPHGATVVDLRRSRTITALPGLAAYLRRRRPRALLATLEHANAVALLAGRLAGHGGVSVREANILSRDIAGGPPRNRVVLWLMRRLYRRAHAVIAVSQGVADDLVATLPLPAERVRVIPNPVITSRLERLAREPLDHPWFAPGEPPVVLGVGRLTTQKGFDTLIEAFARARVRLGCRLVLLGEGEERGALERLAATRGVAQEVAMPGFVDNPFPYMARAGAFVLSSRWEGLPNVLIQALALGASAVATDCPSGPAEVVEGSERAVLVPVDDAAALAEGIATALAAGRGRQGDAWRERYLVGPIARRYLEAVGAW